MRISTERVSRPLRRLKNDLIRPKTQGKGFSGLLAWEELPKKRCWMGIENRVQRKEYRMSVRLTMPQSETKPKFITGGTFWKDFETSIAAWDKLGYRLHSWEMDRREDFVYFVMEYVGLGWVKP